MLRDLMSRFGRSSRRKSRRNRRGNGLRHSLAIENLEQRTVLSATLPTLQMSPETVGTTGQFVTLNYLARFTDVVDAIEFNDDAGGYVAVLSNYSYSIDWGDETSPDTGTTFPSVPIQDLVGAQIDGKIKGRHIYAEDGEYTVTVSLMEDDGDELTTVTSTMTILVADAFDPHGDDQQFQFTGLSGPVAEGSPVSVSFALPESVNPDDIVGWTVSWGDQTVEYTGNPPSIAHVYADFYKQFEADNFDDQIGNVYYISAHVQLTAGGIGDAAYAGGTYGTGFAFYNGLFDKDPTVSIDGSATVGKDATYTLNLHYGDDVPADRPVVWRIFWDTSNPVFESFVGDLSTASHVYTEAGTYNILAQAVNDDNSSYFAFWDVTVGDRPVADAGGTYTTLAGVPIQLTGTGTNGTGLTYSWDLNGNGEFGEEGEDTAEVEFHPGSLAVTKTVQFKVTDANGVESEVVTATIHVLASGTLIIDDTLYVVPSGAGSDTVQVSMSGSSIVVNSGSGPQSFLLSAMEALDIRTGAGNDIVTISAAVNVPTRVDGGDGDDILIGGSGRSELIGGAGTDIIYGGAGDDVLLGGTGNDLLLGGGGNDALVGGGGVDILEGGNGRDLLVGGAGSDAILGGDGEDILIGGYTTHDSDIDALDDIMEIWSGAGNFNSRISNLNLLGLLQANQDLFDDNAIDILTGGAGSDLIFGDRSLLQDGVIDLIALQSAQDRLIALN